MIEENMRVLVRGDKPDQEIIGQVIMVVTADELIDMSKDEEERDFVRALNVSHIAAIMAGSPSHTMALFKILLRNGEWYLLNGEHLTIETIGVHRG